MKNGDASACRLWRMCGLGGEFDVKHQTWRPKVKILNIHSSLLPQLLPCSLHPLHPRRNKGLYVLWTSHLNSIPVETQTNDIYTLIRTSLHSSPHISLPLKSKQSNFHLLSSLHTSTLQIILKSKRNYVAVDPITAGESDSQPQHSAQNMNKKAQSDLQESRNSYQERQAGKKKPSTQKQAKKTVKQCTVCLFLLQDWPRLHGLEMETGSHSP